MAGDPSSRGRRLLDSFGPGSRVGGYRLEAPLGAGGMGAVFRAHDEALDRVVALKVVYAGTGIDQVIRERFVREALSSAKVDHPHIIPVFAAGEDGDLMFIAMRYSAGGDLRSRIKRDGPFAIARAAAAISPVASALDAAHELGVVHRDVKPANILADDGHGRRPVHVYLSDFGLARAALESGGLTGDGQFVGTPDYAAPEQIRGHMIDGQADQYSLAGVAYTVLTGKVPFIRENPMAVLYAHLDAAPPRVTDLRPDLSPDVDYVLARGMAKVPGQRFGSCGEFAEALQDALGLAPYDSTMLLAVRQGQAQPPVPAPRPAVREWAALVTSDRSYYEGVRAANEAEAEVIHFPEQHQDRRVPLDGQRLTIGRRSRSRNIEPDIDLSGDFGVSALHAILATAPDGSWLVADQGSSNGTQVNGREIPAHEPVPLRDGDYINLGAWTRITITTG
ncbi:MAG: FHA domain-containing serine/threonine-protein kinase [Streptosporangiales bacterium]|nr:FHA domain-containing serine/threonine-protein kinase [Streptosporangiales bacterium]